MATLHNPSIHYRPEIDGLRAIAVIPVVLFHAGFSIFSGGFVGVDIFFVISGYLITSILLKEMAQGKFSILNFYERRARRILPALFFVIICCLPFAWFLLTPDDLKLFSTSLIAVALFISNIYFWRNTDYFAPAAEDQPLLHTWSLSVEEQFYVILPIVLLLFFRIARAHVGLVVATLAVLSFALCEYAWRVNPIANFYSLPTRVWELLVGSLIAIFALHGGFLAFNQKIKSILPLIGIFLIGISIFCFDKTTPFPSAYTLLPVFGSALILSFSSPSDIVGKFLASKWLVAIGVCSYSIYLWHQPVFVFFRSISIEALSISDYILAMALTGILSVLTLYFIERPFRKLRANRNRILVASTGLLFVMFFLGFTGRYFNGFESRLNVIEVQQLAYYDAYRSDSRQGRCFLSNANKGVEEFADECFGASHLTPKLYLLGDSHAAALYKNLQNKLPKDLELVQLTMSGCYPILGNGRKGPPHCRKLSDGRFNAVETNEQSWVLLHANWPADQLLDEKNALKDDLVKTIHLLSQRVSPEHIVLVGCVPTWTPTLPKYLLKKGLLGNPEAPQYIFNADFELRNRCNLVLEKVAKDHGATFFNPMKALCRDDQCLVNAQTALGGTILTTSDQTHLTYEGASIVVGKLLKDLVLKAKGE